MPKYANDPDVQALWETYWETHEKQIRDELIVRYYPLARRIAGRVWKKSPSQVDLDDLVSYGVMGLLRAIDHYNPGKGVSFETYALVTVRGGILDEIRSNDWAPRSLRRRQREIEKAVSEHENSGAGHPTLADIAARTGLTEREIADTLYATENAKFKSLDERDDDSDQPRYIGLADHRAVDPEAQSISACVAQAVTSVIRELPEVEQLVIVLYYFEGLTLSEAGQVCGISESRASEVHTKTMLQIRDEMAGALKVA